MRPLLFMNGASITALSSSLRSTLVASATGLPSASCNPFNGSPGVPVSMAIDSGDAQSGTLAGIGVVP